jgi:hypothetical protein
MPSNDTKMIKLLKMIGELDNYDDIRTAYAALGAKRDFLTRSQVDVLDVGDEVSFLSRGRTVIGRVRKINRKTILVEERGSSTVWKVPAAMLTKVVGEVA